MKRLISLALAALLAGTSAAAADPSWGSHQQHWNRASRDYHGYPEYRHHGSSDTAAAVGLGIFALGAIALIAAQNDHHPAYEAYPSGAYRGNGGDEYYGSDYNRRGEYPDNGYDRHDDGD